MQYKAMNHTPAGCGVSHKNVYIHTVDLISKFHMQASLLGHVGAFSWSASQMVR
eukprot:m.130280 g.130280  ORF g.130280 m.130280 type:complete len:54 (-) comp13897_c0_seq2:693-854(-)